jgi:hypothetical protein
MDWFRHVTMGAMQSALSAYGALIRAPIIGPFARFPLRLLRWFLQDPDLDPSTRADRLTMELVAVREQLGQLTLAHQTLCQDQERTRLILFMISGQLDPHDLPKRPESPRQTERRPWASALPTRRGG